jgi:hypothetical protein
MSGTSALETADINTPAPRDLQHQTLEECGLAA